MRRLLKLTVLASVVVSFAVFELLTHIKVLPSAPTGFAKKQRHLANL